MSNVDVEDEYEDRWRVSSGDKTWKFWVTWLLLGTVLFGTSIGAYGSGAALVGGLAAAFAVAYGLTWIGARYIVS